MKKAITLGDLAYAKTPRFKTLLQKTNERILAIKDRTELKTVVNVSGGKDSTVMLHLFRQVMPDVNAVNLCVKEAESADTMALLETQKVDFEPIAGDFIDLLKRHGKWGYRGPEYDPTATKDPDWFNVLILDPSYRYCARNQCNTIALGLRGQENRGRLMNWVTRGSFYFTKERNEYHAIPIGDWSDKDVWAYIADQDVPYNPLYDKMTTIGIPRDQQRVSLWFGLCSATVGRMAIWKQIEPESFYRFSTLFPSLKTFV